MGSETIMTRVIRPWIADLKFIVSEFEPIGYVDWNKGFYIINDGGTLRIIPLEWEEAQVCNVAIREVPLKSDGAVVDTGTWTLKPRTLSVKTRLSDCEKSVLEEIFDESKQVNLRTTLADGWNFVGWLEDKIIRWDYRVMEVPDGEMVVDGDFVSGDLYAWNYLEDYAEVVEDPLGSGDNACKINVDFCQGICGWIEQDICVPVDAISSITLSAYCTQGIIGVDFLVTLTYNDDTTTEITLSYNLDDEWQEFDITSYLTSGKTLKTIKISMPEFSSNAMYIKDVSISC